MNIEIKISKKPILYQAAIDFLEERAFNIHSNKGRELIWILEHQDIYTCGTSGKDFELLEKNFLPTIKTNRGGKWTYHGKGQKVVYFVLDLNKRGREIKQLVRNVENWIIETLKVFKINSYNDPNNIGIWVKKDNLEYKIAAIGIKVKKWVAYHGFALNLDVNMNNYKAIIPCGIKDKGLINFSEIAKLPSEETINKVILDKFEKIFINQNPSKKL
jgi:lipoyl(octanoyl) transferase